MGKGGGDGNEKQENGMGAEDFRGGSKNTENAPLFSASTRVYARVQHTRERTRKRGVRSRGARGERERERDRESERKAVVARGSESAREQLERIVFTRGMTG